METLDPLWPVVRFGVLLAGLLVPGAALFQALQLPRTLATSFAGSALSLYLTVLALQLSGTRISLASIAAGLAVITLGAVVLRRWTQPRPGNTPKREKDDRMTGHSPDERLPPDGDFHPESGGVRLVPFTEMGGWTPLYGLFWAAVVFRMWSEPLAGPDVEFRWGFLAEQMLRLGSLDFYPPRSAADFVSYFWVESIPPGTAALHAWAYACAGGPIPSWALPGVLLQLVAVHELLWRIAHRLGGPVAARFAVLAAAACPLLVWSILIGQETGLTALSLAGILFCTGQWSDTRQAAWTMAAAGFAVIGAAAREYGLVFIAIGALALAGTRGSSRAWLGYGSVAALGLVWPARIWGLTGNPVYSLGIGGLFPINERFVAWISAEASVYGPLLKSAAGWLDLIRYLALFAAPAVAGGVILIVAAQRRIDGARTALAAVAVVLGLWLMSVPYTNGGLFYSLRVASPALTIGALTAGLGVAFWTGRVAARQRIATLVMGSLVAGLLPAILALPRNPWRETWRNWPAFTPPVPPATGEDDPTVMLITNALKNTPSSHSTPAGVLADSPGYQRRFLPTGLSVAPLWSPQADWLFDLGASLEEAARRWRASGVGYVVLTKRQANVDFLNSRSRWNRPPFHVQMIGETDSTVVFSIRAGN